MPWYDHANQLTDRQAEVFFYFVRHTEEHGRPPTVREIGKRFGISSPNGVVCHIDALCKKGYLLADEIPGDGERTHHHYRVARVRWQAVDLTQGETNDSLRSQETPS